MQQLHMLLLNVVVTRRFPKSCVHIVAVFNELLLYLIPLGVDILPSQGCLLVVGRLLLSFVLIELGERDEIFWQRVLLLLNIS